MVSMTGNGGDDLHRIHSRCSSMRANCKADFTNCEGMAWINNIPSCPTFYPTLEEFEDPLSYLESIVPEASKYGICKIVSPISPTVPAGVVLMREKSGFKFTTRVQPMKITKWDSDDQTKYYMSGRKYSFREYEKIANKIFAYKFSTSANLPANFIERQFWHEITSGRTEFVEYACDVVGSAFSSSAKDPLGSSKWNLQDISKLDKSVLSLLDSSIPGVTDPMLYIGMLFSMFAWHVEDHYLYSINYHHCGASKTWYGVPGHAANDLERVVLEHLYKGEMHAREGWDTAFNLLAGKTTMFPPGILCEHGVPVYKAVQEPGDFIITFPQAYHAGFSHGFNCGEAVNFALDNWYSFGEAACKRYKKLNRPQILPQEQLLCKKAMMLANNDSICSNKNQHFVKVAFVGLMKLQNQYCYALKRQGANIFYYSPSYPNCVPCSICNSWCYMAFCICQSNMHCTCLNHAMKCGCGGLPTVYLRENICEMEAAADNFLCEEGVLADCLKELPDHMKDSKEHVPFSELILVENQKGYSASLLDYKQSHASEMNIVNGRCCGAIKSTNLGDMESASEVIRVKRQCRPVFNRINEDVDKTVSEAQLDSPGKANEISGSKNGISGENMRRDSESMNNSERKSTLRIRIKIKGPSLQVKSA